MLTLNRQCSVEFLLGPRVLHHRLHRDQCLGRRHECLRLTLGKRVREQRSPSNLLFRLLVMNDVWVAIHCFVRLWIF